MSEVEVDEVLGFCRVLSAHVRYSWSWRRNVRTMGHETSKVPPDDAMPCGALSLVKCSLDVLGNVLPSVVLATTVGRLGGSVSVSQPRGSARESVDPD